MRKTFITIASLMMTLIMGLTFLGGCKLITTNSKKDMNQVIATVKISSDMEKADEIYKKDIAMAYLNYGYMYEYSYGYTREKVVKMIVNNLVNNRVYVQYAMQEFNKSNETIVDSTKGNWDIDRYLTASEKMDALYSTVKNMNELITSYMDVEDKVQDSMPEAVRTIPTNAKNAEKKLDDTQKGQYVYGKDYPKTDYVYTDSDVIIDDGVENAERRKAYNKVINLLRSNELLGDYTNSLTETTYYQETLQSHKEQALLDRFEKSIITEARKTVSLSDLAEVYADRFNTQNNMTETEFAEKLSSATASDPVLVNNNGTYGYVYNLLLGANDTTTAKITKYVDDWKKLNPQPTVEEKEQFEKDKAEYRKDLFNNITVKDMRYSWIWSGYDGQLSGTEYTFTGDYAFATDSLPFQGDVKLLNPVANGEEEPENYKAEYSVTNVRKFNLTSFIEMMETYLYGGTQNDVKKTDAPNAYYKVVNVDGDLAQYDEKINELLFAFSTDSGSLNTYKGYSIAPVPELGGSETYMQEFADAGRILLGMDTDARADVLDSGATLGNKSYIMVATDYGYHIMFYSQVFDNTFAYETLDEYLEAFCNKYGKADWQSVLNDMIDNWDDFEDKDHFLYTLFDSVASTKVNTVLTNAQNKILNDYVYNDGGYVVKYESRYAELLIA
ncbi:MAG: hypothetical protein IKB67_00230 [Clostridia bacterium]|nr:hypothetical protein [Clostridia bacterium]